MNQFLKNMSKYPLDKLKVKKFRREIEPNEILLDALSLKKEKEIGMTGKKLEVPISQRIFSGVWVGILILFSVFFGRTFQLQVIEGKTLSEQSEKNKFVVKAVGAERGVIYGKNFNQLIYNKPSFNFICDGKITMENIDHETLLKLETSLKEYKGCKIENNTVREYFSGPLFSHSIGYLRQAGQSSGLEQYYDEMLAPKTGELRIKRDAMGNPMSEEIVSMPESGNSLVLWIDSGLQEKITRSLEKAINMVGAKGGAAVAMDPKTGGILALVSLPSFDNNLFSQGLTEDEWNALQGDRSNPLFNRVVSGRYLTGSIIKPLIASAALQEKIISPEKELYCGGSISIQNPWDPTIFTIKKDWDIHGWSDMKKSIAESCNVYFYTIGGGYQDQKGLGPTKIKEYLDIFGWSSLTGIDLPEEAQGFVPDKEWKKKEFGQSWWDGDTYNLAIGQGFLLISPLEVITSLAAVANGGKLIQPQVVRQVVDSSKNIIKEFETKLIRENFIDSDNLQIVREGMRQAVTGQGSPHASGVILNSLPVAAALKTGTAEIGAGFRHNWVTVFAPYDDPQIILTVLIEKVEGDQVVALPLAREILDWYFSTPRGIDNNDR